MDCHIVESQGCAFNVHAIVSQYSKNEEKWHFKRQLGLIHLRIIACNNSSCSFKCIFHTKMHCHGFCYNTRNLVSNKVLQARSLHSQFCSTFTLWTSDCKMHVVDLPPFLEWENWKCKPSRLVKSSMPLTKRFPNFLSGIKLLFHIRKQDRRMCFAFVAYRYIPPPRLFIFLPQLPTYAVTFPSASNPPRPSELVSRKPLLLPSVN